VQLRPGRRLRAVLGPDGVDDHSQVPRRHRLARLVERRLAGAAVQGSGVRLRCCLFWLLHCKESALQLRDALVLNRRGARSRAGVAGAAGARARASTPVAEKGKWIRSSARTRRTWWGLTRPTFSRGRTVRSRHAHAQARSDNGGGGNGRQRFSHVGQAASLPYKTALTSSVRRPLGRGAPQRRQRRHRRAGLVTRAPPTSKHLSLARRPVLRQYHRRGGCCCGDEDGVVEVLVEAERHIRAQRSAKHLALPRRQPRPDQQHAATRCKRAASVG